MLTVKTPTTWSLPLYNDQKEMAFKSVIVKMSPSLEAFVTYNTSDRSLHFDGNENSAKLANKLFVIDYSLENLDGEWATFKQTVIVLPEDGLTDGGGAETCMVSFAEGTLNTIDYQIGSGL